MSTINANIINSFDRVRVPIYTTAQRDAISPSAETGLIIFNSTIGNLQVYNGTAWVAILQTPGLTAGSPAVNAAQIRTAGITTNGNYWYQPAGQTAPIQLYTQFTNAPAGKGYVLVARGRESTNWWNTNGQNTNALTSASLDTNTPIAVLSNSFVNGLIGNQWNGMRFISNRRNGGDSWIFVGTTTTTFSWTYFQQNASSVNATAVQYNGLFLTGGARLTYGSGNRWTDTLAYGNGNNCDRTFTWSWSGHGSWQGWSGGSACTPAGSFQNGSEGHAIQLVNCYVEC